MDASTAPVHPPNAALATTTGGGKVLRKRKVARKPVKKTKRACPKPKKCPKPAKKSKKASPAAWKRTSVKAMVAGEMRTVWLGKDGERAVRRVKTMPNGDKKYYFRRI